MIAQVRSHHRTSALDPLDEREAETTVGGWGPWADACAVGAYFAPEAPFAGCGAGVLVYWAMG